MTTIRSFINLGEASFVVSLLQANGFDAVLLDEGAFQWEQAAFITPMRLQVPDEQAAEAIRFLTQVPETSAGHNPASNE